MNDRGTLVSGHNPMMGPRQLGHYVASIMEWPELQERYDCFFEVDDIIAALIYPRDRAEMLNRTFYVVKDIVASGVDLNRCSIVVSSQVPEFLELMLWLGAEVDRSYCDRLHSDSFTGLISPRQRRQVGLTHHTSVTEWLYPQIGPAVAAIGLQATAFHGGEEISGYVDVIDSIVERVNRHYRAGLVAAEYLAPRCAFVRGTDGTHMISGNHVSLSGSEAEVRAACDSVVDTSILRHWYTILGEDASAAGLPDSGVPTQEDTRRMADFLLDRFEPFRTIKISNADLVDIVAIGADRARERAADTLALVKEAMGVWDFARLRTLRLARA